MSMSEKQGEQEQNDGLQYEAPFYWLTGTSQEAQKEGPYCQKCYDEEQQLILLQNPYGGSRYLCPACNSQFFEPVDEDEKDYFCFCSGE